MNKGCAPFETELSAYVDGELDAAERARVEAHVHGCARCAAEIRELRRVGDTLRRWDAHETRYATSTGFRNRVFTLLGGAGETSDDARTWRRAAWAAAAAAGVVGAFAWATSREAAQATDLETLAARVRAMEGALAARQHPADDAAAGGPTVREPIAVERLGTLPPLVGAPEEAPHHVAMDESDDPWEVRGEGTLHRDAVPDYDEFQREQRLRSLEEKLLAKVDHKDDGATSAVAAAPAPPLASFLGRLTLSPTAYPAFERVQVWPIERTAAMRVIPPVTLGKAIEESVLRVSEERDTDAVVAENADLRGRSVLLLAGDVIKGGRRDRVLREDLLVPPGRKISLPVFGAGAVRERTRSFRFTRSLLVAPFDLRGLVATSYVGARVDQRDVDQTVFLTLNGLGSRRDDGGSIENLSTNPVLSQEVARYTKEFRARLDGKHVVGFAFAVGSRVVGADVCGDPETFRALRDRLLGSHVLYALAGDVVQGAPPAESDVESLLTAASRAVFAEPPATSDATLSVFRERDGQVFGYGLLDGTRVIHAAVFAGMPAGPATEASAKGHTPFGGPPVPAPGAREPGTGGKTGGSETPGPGLDK